MAECRKAWQLARRPVLLLGPGLCTAKKYSQRCRPGSTSADPSSTIPTPADYNRPLARNSKTEGRGFESFRPCHLPNGHYAHKPLSTDRYLCMLLGCRECPP